MQVRFDSAARRRSAILAAVALGHVGLLASMLLLATPTLRFETYDEPVFTVELLRPPTDQPSAPSPTPPPRFNRPTPRESAVAPLYVPSTKAPAPTPGAAPPPSFAEPGDDIIRRAFRTRAPGCANRDAVRLTPAERAACDERFGDGAKDAPFLEAAIGKEKRGAFEAAAAKKRRDWDYKRANIPPGSATPSVLGKGVPSRDCPSC